MELQFEKETVTARFIDPSGKRVEREVEIRTNPITLRTCRIAYNRIAEKEPGTDVLPEAPPDAGNTANCPFCRPQVEAKTPQLLPRHARSGRLVQGASVLFPNLFPYGSYSAVSIFDNSHFVEIGTASRASYTDCLRNCSRYLQRVLEQDPAAVFTAITQNHLPSAGGSLLHPHLQINADPVPSNHHRFLRPRANRYFQKTGAYLFSDYLRHEKEDGRRYIGKTGPWEWTAAFAPEGFYEIWGILPEITTIRELVTSTWKDLARGLLNTQRFYRSLCRNGYNMGLLMVEDGASRLELRVTVLARSNYAPWVRSDHTAYELMLGDMATFTSPEETAENARPFWRPVD